MINRLKMYFMVLIGRHPYTENVSLIQRIGYIRRFTAGKDSYEDFIKTSLYRIFPQRLISWSHDGPELLKYPETWISSSEVNK
jgi:hypothetical protein